MSRPQVYINVTGGLAEPKVTRGDVDIIHIDWDNLREADSIFDLEDAREDILRIEDDAYRRRLLNDIDDLIKNHEDRYG